MRGNMSQKQSYSFSNFFPSSLILLGATLTLLPWGALSLWLQKFDYPQVVSMFIPLTCGIVTALWVRRWLTDWIDCETTNEEIGCSENVFLDHERKQAGSAPVRSLIIVPPQRSGSRPVGSGYIGAPHRALSSSYPLVTIQVGRP